MVTMLTETFLYDRFPIALVFVVSLFGFPLFRSSNALLTPTQSAANLYYSSLRHRLGYRKNGAAYHWITYRDLARRVDHYEGLLRSIGVLAGDRIGLICGNRFVITRPPSF